MDTQPPVASAYTAVTFLRHDSWPMLAGTAPVRPLLNAFMAQKGSAVQFAVQSHVHVPLGDGIEIEFTSPAHAMACSSSVSLRARAHAHRHAFRP